MKRVVKATNKTRDSFLAQNKIWQYSENDQEIIFDNIENLKSALEEELSAKVEGVDATVDAESSTTGKQVWLDVTFWYNNRPCKSERWLVNLGWFLDWDTLWKKIHRSTYYKDTVKRLDVILPSLIVSDEFTNADLSYLFKKVFDLDCDVESEFNIEPKLAHFLFYLNNYMQSPKPNILLDEIIMGFFYIRDENFAETFAGYTAEEILNMMPLEYDPHEALATLKELVNDVADILPDEVSLRVGSSGRDSQGVAFELWRTSSNITDFSDKLIIGRPVDHRVRWKNIDTEFNSIVQKVKNSIDGLLSDMPVGDWEELAVKRPYSGVAEYLRDKYNVEFDETGRRVQR